MATRHIRSECAVTGMITCCSTPHTRYGINARGHSAPHNARREDEDVNGEAIVNRGASRCRRQETEALSAEERRYERCCFAKRSRHVIALNGLRYVTGEQTSRYVWQAGQRQRRMSRDRRGTRGVLSALRRYARCCQQDKQALQNGSYVGSSISGARNHMSVHGARERIALQRMLVKVRSISQYVLQVLPDTSLISLRRYVRWYVITMITRQRRCGWIVTLQQPAEDAALIMSARYSSERIYVMAT